MKLFLLCVLLTSARPAFQQTLPRGVEQKASLAGITQYDFPNGLRVLLFPDPSNPKVTINMTYLVGSRFEGYGETGMAHLLEHLNFIRSTHDREIKKELTDHGAQWNGGTDYDRTNYFETVTASDENLRWAEVGSTLLSLVSRKYDQYEHQAKHNQASKDGYLRI